MNKEQNSAFFAKPTPPEDTEVLTKVCERLGFRVENVLMRRRFGDVVRQRHEVMKALNTHNWSTYRIARTLGLKDHGTVIHGLKKS